MSVVQRCPNCGTTAASAGACQACHEAQVRYFCTNHTPGVWLDTATCSKCGARFGAMPSAKPEPPRARDRTRTRTGGSGGETGVAAPSVGPRRARTKAPAPYAASPSPESRAERYAHAERSAAESEPAPLAAASPMIHWVELLKAAARARYAAAPVRDTPATPRGIGGCLVRVLMLLMLIFFAVIAAVFFFGRALLQGY